METQERRKHLRCTEDIRIVYSFINKSEQHAAVARNYSRFGMYFESNAPLTPGTTVIIRTLGCDTASDPDAGSFEHGPSPFYCQDSQTTVDPCRDLKSLVTAEVKRCETRQSPSGESYGIGVHFVGPAV
jgi:hypothetical protein